MKKKPPKPTTLEEQADGVVCSISKAISQVVEQTHKNLLLLLQSKQDEIHRLRQALRPYVDHYCHDGLPPSDDDHRRARDASEGPLTLGDNKAVSNMDKRLSTQDKKVRDERQGRIQRYSELAEQNQELGDGYLKRKNPSDDSEETNG